MLKKCGNFLLSLLLCLNLFVGIVPETVFGLDNVQALSGQGTESDPYLIKDEDDLKLMSSLINSGDSNYTGNKVYKLQNDIIIENQFVMIQSFSGVFDGNGHSISSLKLKDNVNRKNFRIGFIGENLGKVINTGFIDSEIITEGKYNNSYKGGLMAGTIAAMNKGTISKCSVINGKVISDGCENCGGITGNCQPGSAVEHCYFQGTVKAYRQPAGIAGYAYKSTINGCFVEAAITSSSAFAGLICAYPNTSVITNNVVYDGSISGGKDEGPSGRWTHRIIGLDDKMSTLTIKNNLCNSSVAKFDQDGANTQISNGQDVTSQQLTSQDTYKSIGWDFDNVWTMNEKYNRPMLKFAKVLPKSDRITVTYNGDPKTRKAFTWYTPISASNSVVRVSKTKDFKSYTDIESSEELVSGGYMHKSVVSGLTADTEYYYKVGDVDSNSFTNVATFKTAKEDGEFSFINLTDSQAKSTTEALLAANTYNQAMKCVPDSAFILHGGDIVQTGDSETDWENMINFPSDVMMNTTIVPTAGNHDYQTDEFKNHFNLEAVNSQDTSTGVYYSFDYSNTHFTVLNTNEDSEKCISDSQIEWLKNDVNTARANGAKWFVLSLHKGLYTTGTHMTDSDIMEMRKILVPVVDELNIDIVLQGHDHVLVRSKNLIYDKNGVADAKVSKTNTYTEIKDGKTIEYSMNPQGTFYVLEGTAGAKHYTQNTDSSQIDMSKYLELFDRTEESTNRQHFAKISISDSKLTVMTYQITNGGTAVATEGFGIDRAVKPVIDKISTIKNASDIIEADRSSINNIYNEFSKLNDAQQDAVSNKDKLFEAVKALGMVNESDENVLHWADSTAQFRQSVQVKNSSDENFTNSPVLLTLKDIPSTADRTKLKVYSKDGLELPVQIESWDNSKASVWVKVPSLDADSVTTLWVYYNGKNNMTHSKDVWNDNYELVEHFNNNFTDGESVTDSTGKHTGVATNNISVSEDEDGRMMGAFNNAKVTYEAFGSGFNKITFSAVYKATQDDATAMNGKNVALIAKDNMENPNTSVDSMLLGINPSAETKAFCGYRGIWAENGTEKSWTTSDKIIPMDGKSHLITYCNDGMTVALYVDGEIKYSAFSESNSLLDKQQLPVTIGAFSDNALCGTYQGLMDEVWITGTSTSPSWEKFRFDNIKGNNVTYSNITENSDEKISLSIGSPLNNSTLDSGKTSVSGCVNKPSVISIKNNDKIIKIGEVPSGRFTLDGQFNGVSDESFEIIAENRNDSTDKTSIAVALHLEDNKAPLKPVISDTSKDGYVTGDSATLNAQTVTDVEEDLSVDFYVNELMNLSKDNVKVYEGKATEKLPDNVSLQGCTQSENMFNKTSVSGENPYQIYEITLSDEELAKSSFHVLWKGKSEREVTTYVKNNTTDKWVLTGRNYDQDNNEISIDMEIENTSDIVKNNKIQLLIWRGMSEKIEGRDTYNARKGEYDFNLMLVPDPQLYTQNYPDLLNKQFSWMADNFFDLKSRMLLFVGDVVNRPYISTEYQWKNLDNAMQYIENKDIPYLIAWGNHDYDYNSGNDIMYKKYYPASRIEKNGGKYFGESMDNDTAYYLMEENGAKIMVLSFPYWAKESEYQWAENVLQSHQNYSTIIVTHKYITRYGKIQDDDAQKMRERLVVPYNNVKLILNGHDSGTNVHYENINGRPVYSVVTDYQNLPYGGGGYIRNIKFDIENDLVYFNTYSPTTGNTWSGYTREPVTQTPGMYKKNMDEFVIPVDFGGTADKTLETTSLTISATDNKKFGDSYNVVGSKTVSNDITSLKPGHLYEWMVKVTDKSGKITKSDYKALSVATPDKKDLIALIASYNVNKDEYTQESYSDFETALKTAQGVIDDNNATQKSIDNAKEKLKKVYEQLVKKQPTEPEAPVKPVEPATPSIIDGNNSEIDTGSNKSVSFRSNADIKYFVEVRIDGKVVAPSNYTVTQGSTIITFKPEFLRTLSAGKHTISIVSTIGSADTNFIVNQSSDNVVSGDNKPTENHPDTNKNENNIVNNPHTGDIAFYSIYLLFSLLFILVIVKRKTNNK